MIWFRVKNNTFWCMSLLGHLYCPFLLFMSDRGSYLNHFNADKIDLFVNETFNITSVASFISSVYVGRGVTRVQLQVVKCRMKSISMHNSNKALTHIVSYKLEWILSSSYLKTRTLFLCDPLLILLPLYERSQRLFLYRRLVTLLVYIVHFVPLSIDAAEGTTWMAVVVELSSLHYIRWTASL